MARVTGELARGGGLMRCCIASLAERLEMLKPYPWEVGDRLTCPWCSSSMVIASDGVWEWLPK